MNAPVGTTPVNVLFEMSNTSRRNVIRSTIDPLNRLFFRFTSVIKPGSLVMALISPVMLQSFRNLQAGGGQEEIR